jgi:hypothetical protein
MHPVYHAKITVSTKNFPRSEVKVWRKGSRPVAWLYGMADILVSDNREGYRKGESVRDPLWAISWWGLLAISTSGMA